MLKHMIDIITNTYYIYKDDVIIFSIDLKNDKVEARGYLNYYDGKLEELLLKKYEPDVRE